MQRDMDRKNMVRSRLAAFVAAGLAISAGVLGGGLAFAGLSPQSAGIPQAQAPAVVTQPGKLYGQLADKVQNATGETRLRVIVHLREQADLSTWPASDRPGALRVLQNVAERTQPQVVNAAQSAAASVNVYERYWIFNGFAMEAPASTIHQIAQREDVAYIIEDGYITMPRIEVVQDIPDDPTTNWNIYQVRAPEVWALGYDGTGRVVANMDSGVQGDHPALVSRWRGTNGGTPANSWYDPYGLSPTFPSDPNGHGTHTMGTIAGYQGDNTGPNEIGQSKGALWIAARNYDASGKGPFSKIHDAFEWFLDPDGDPTTNDQPDVVNNSWGDSGSFQYPDTEWWNDVEAWRAVGIIPVFSNGNNGGGPSTAGKPGSYPINIGTGAIAQNRAIAGFSSRGPAPNMAPWNNSENWERSNWGLIKPDVVAPGVSIRSSVPGSGYGLNQGTSMASPHVAGMAGLLRQIRPDLTYNEFYNIILDTAYWQSSFGIRPNNNFGWGEIDDYAAAIYVRDAGAILGTITDGSCDVVVPGVKMEVFAPCTDANAPNGECGIRRLKSDNNGNYRTILAAGNYTVTVSAPGYYGQTFLTQVMSTTTNTLPITLVKMPGGTVSGTVTDGTNPVAGASVSVDGLSNVRTTADATGHYTLTNVPAGTFTVRAEACGYQAMIANVTMTYPGNLIRNFTLTLAPALLFNDFEDGTLNDWTVVEGNPANGVWHNSDLRGFNSARALRAGRPTDPYTYTGTVSTTVVANATWDTSAADKVWLSFDLYDSAESEYDVFKAWISTDGGATWPVTNTVFGQASPVHGWQHICLDVTQWKSAQMKLRFTFRTDANNWNGESFEGPSVDNVRVSSNGPASGGTPVPAQTPTPGTPIPCTPNVPTATPTVTIPVGTPTTGATGTAQATATACTITFLDVPPSHTFYPFIRCLACRGIVNGYPDGTFLPNNPVTRGQLAKIVSQSAGFTEPVSGQTFEDVVPGSTFYEYIERLASRQVMGGYVCGVDPSEPCVGPENRPYFRPNAGATRGQLTKIVSNAAGFNDTIPDTQYQFTDVEPGSTFWLYVERLLLNRPGVMSGYPCGGPGEPCDSENRPYFRPGNPLTRGQTSKIVANTFFPNCQTPGR